MAKLSNTEIIGTIKITGGNPGIGKVLVSSDVVGNAVWEEIVVEGGSTNLSTSVSGTGESRLRTITSSSGNNVTIPNASTTDPGFMSIGDKSKLNGIAAGAQVNVPTNLTYSTAVSSGTVSSSTGTPATIPAATTSLAGLMSCADKIKLNGIAAGAQVNVGTNLGTSLTGTGAARQRIISSSTGTNVTVPNASTTDPGFMDICDKCKLDNIALNADNFNNFCIATNGTAGTQSIGSSGLICIIGSTNVTATRTANCIVLSSTNTTYSEISTAEIQGTTNSTARLITGRRMQHYRTTCLDSRYPGCATNNTLFGTLSVDNNVSISGAVSAQNGCITTLGVGNATTPVGPAHIGGSSTSTNGIGGVFLRIHNTATQANNRMTGFLMGMSANNICPKAGIYYVRCGANYLGDMVFALNTSTLTGTQVSTSDAVMTLCRTGDVIIDRDACGRDFIATSDIRIKRDIEPLSNGLSMVNQLNPVKYKLCCDDIEECRIGLIAQEVLPIIPELVSKSEYRKEDYELYGIEDGKYGVKYEKLSAVLVQSIKELTNKIDYLENKVFSLEMELNHLKNKIQ